MCYNVFSCVKVFKKDPKGVKNVVIWPLFLDYMDQDGNIKFVNVTIKSIIWN